MHERGPGRHGSQNIGIRQSLWVDNFYMTCLCQIIYKHWINTFIKLLNYKANAGFRLDHELRFAGMEIL